MIIHCTTGTRCTTPLLLVYSVLSFIPKNAYKSQAVLLATVTVFSTILCVRMDSVRYDTRVH